MKKKVLYATAECYPFAGSSSLAEISYSLSKQINGDKYEVRVIMPLYSEMSPVYISEMEYLGSKDITLSWRVQRANVFKARKDGVTCYFIDNDYYFKRKNLFGHMDDIERFAFFNKAVLDVFDITGFIPDIIHCHDWQTALIPVYLKILFAGNEEYSRIKTVFTIHHIEHQGKLDTYAMEDILGISQDNMCIMETGGKVNLIKGAIVVSDVLTTVSPNYKDELFGSEQALGLENIIRQNRDKFFGILLGIDYADYDPQTDRNIYRNYNMHDFTGRSYCKEKLQETFGLSVNPDTPIIAVITKLVNKKGVDLLKSVLPDILNLDVQFILLGKGEKEYESFFEGMEKRYTTKLRTVIGVDSDVARKLFSGSDFFLMPSQTEPCGRSQMIGSRYGAIPIVRKTGGLADSIADVQVGGNGYVFEGYQPSEMLDAIKRAVSDYKNKSYRISLIDKVMRTDFSWARTAEQYEKRYDILTRDIGEEGLEPSTEHAEA
ncbi:MAG: glycogen/starch synthase [Clostridia bacterium]|nr:glycogen/starch synthase [Clostridia bacterium]